MSKDKTGRADLEPDIQVVDAAEDVEEIKIDGLPDEAQAEPDIKIAETDNDETPIDVLRRNLEEVKAEKEAADRRAFEAERARQHAAAQVQQLSYSELINHKAVLEQAYSAEEIRLADTKRKYSESMQVGDYNSAADAQTELVRINNDMSRYQNAYQALEQKEQQFKVQPQQAPSVAEQFDYAIQQLHPKVSQWAREHKDDLLNPENQQIAFAADVKARKRGYTPGTPEYISYLDYELGYGADDGDPVPARQAAQVHSNHSKRAVAAPASRAAGSKTVRVELDDFDKQTARELGMTQVEYAKYKLKSKERSAQDRENYSSATRYSR